MAFKVDLPQIEIGVSYSHALRWSLQDENGVVTPVDLSAWEGRMQFRKKITDVVEYLDVSTANNRMVLTGNLIQIEVEASITKALVPVEDGVVDLVLWPTANPEAAVRLAYSTFSAVRISTALPTP